MVTILEEFSKNIRSQILVDFKTSELFEHNLLKGQNNESILIERLRTYLPKKYSLTTGKLFDSENNRSDEIDIIIYDNFHNSEIISLKRASLVPVEISFAVISVKTKLTKPELVGYRKKKGCICNIKTAKQLKKINGLPLNLGSTKAEFSYAPTIGIIFAYDSPPIFTVAKNFIIGNRNESIEKNEQIDFICIFNKGIIINDKQNDRIKIISSSENEDEKYKTFLNFIMMLMSHLNSMPMTTLDLSGYLKPEFYQSQSLIELNPERIR